MKPDIEKASSRPLGVANALRKQPLDETTVYQKLVILTGEAETLKSPNGRRCLTASLLLLGRVVGNLVVALPAEADNFRQEVADIASSMWSRKPIKVIVASEMIPLSRATAVLNVGSTVPAGGTGIAINSHGWIARLSQRHPLPAVCSQSNPMGALMAASFGATEVFKRVFDVDLDLAPPVEWIEYSLFDQGSSPIDPGPALPDILHFPDTLVVGGGAIGNAMAWLFAVLPGTGRIHFVDKQVFADENLGTCLLLEATGWLGQPKAVQLAAWLQPRCGFQVTGEQGLIEEVKGGATVKSMVVNLVINGLDDVEARRQAQTLWPRVTVDGAINNVGAAVIQHHVGREDMSCLRCWFEPALVDHKAIQSRASGLSAESLGDLDRELTDEDIVAAAAEKREWLTGQRVAGKRLCSIVSEAVMSEQLGVDLSVNFRPSVPFVATAAAAMAMAEAVKSIAFPTKQAIGQTQIANLFVGANQTVLHLNRPPTKDCQCVTLRNTIQKIVNRRGGNLQAV